MTSEEFSAGLHAFVETEVPTHQTHFASCAFEEDAASRRLLDGVPRPTLLLGRDRRILLKNAAALATPDALACVALSYGCVMRFVGAATEPFDRVFVRALSGIASTALVTIATHGRQAIWRLWLGPLPRIAGFDDRAAVLMLVDPPASSSETPARLKRLFGLTPAEARVLALLIEDRRPREIAEELRISITTVRSHLKVLFAKTGTRRQSELVALAWSAT